MSYESTLAYIHSVHWQNHKPGLGRIQALLAAVGNPHKGLRFVHVAGTNGKGSTCAMLASCLQAAGYRVGLFTSPYLIRFNERIQVDGQQIPDDALEELTDFVRPFAQALPESPTEFELITALGMLWFARQHCDIVVLEVGMGGELDSTNVIDPPEAAVLTAMGLDHIRELGPTMEDIAQKKAGILKSGSSAVSYGGNRQADGVFAARCQALGIPLVTVNHSAIIRRSAGLQGHCFSYGGLENIHLPLVGSYQPDNAALAIEALHLLRQKGWQIPDSAIRRGLEKVRWPGRFEILRNNPLVILDGSHNAHGMQATVESLRQLLPGKKITALLAVCEDKAVDEMLSLLAPCISRAVCVQAATPRAMPAEKLAALVAGYGVPAQAADTVAQGTARALALAGPEGTVCALGTLYFSGEVRQAILGS